MLADYHVHTEFSDDSTADMESVIRAAITAGVEELCFTDHVDYGIKFDHDHYRRMSGKELEKAGIFLNVDYPEYFKKITLLTERYQGQITLKKGLEFGIQSHTIPRYEALFAAWPLDFILLSCHQVEDKEFWTNEFQLGRTPKEYNDRYYEEILACAEEYKNYSVLGHLDMIQRYNGTLYPFEASRPIITEILKTVIRDKKGIEVNTSSFRYGLNDLTPARDILRLYRELGGTILTIGSDCHQAKDVAEHIPSVKAELKALGFTHFCTYQAMVPSFHLL